MRKLIIVDDEGRKTTVPLVRSEVTIGRLEGNTIRLTERNVSRRHARIFRDDGRYFVEDLSRYGTQKNGAKLTETAAFDEGDTVVIGAYRLEFAREASDEADPAATIPLTRPAAGAPSLPAKARKDAATEILPATVAAPEAPRGRLVCMTEPFVGSEFVFAAESLVIGTAQDCDLIIQHRSIAPHHARFDQQDRGYTIHPIDAGYPVALDGRYNPQSAMGSGAELLLGELKFRFALPGESVGLLPLADLEDELIAGTRPAWFVPAMVGAGVAVVLLLGVIMTRGGDTEEVADEPEVAADVLPGASEGAQALERGRALMANADWAEAVSAFESVAEDAPERELALSLATRAANELTHQERFEAARRAFDEGDYEKTLRDLGAIPAGTHYRTRAADEDLERRAISSVVDARLAASQAAQDDDDIGEALRILEEIQPLAPDHVALGARIRQLNEIGSPAERAASRAQADERERDRAAERERERADSLARAEVRERQREADAQNERSRSRAEERAREAASARAEREAAVEPEREAPVAAANTAEAPPSARELRQQAARAGVQQDYQEAIRLLEQARELSPGDAQINLMLFSNYRQVGNRSRAARAIRRYLRQRPDDSRRAEYEAWLAENAPE